MSLLEKLSAQAPANEAAKPAATNDHPTVDSAAWLDGFLVRNADKLPTLQGPEPYQGGRRWIFDVCPWNPDHRNGSAYLIQRGEGTIQAGCHHNGCANKDWHTLRAMIEPKAAPTTGRNDPQRHGSMPAPPHPDAAADSGPVLVKLSDVAAEPVRWLWPGRIAIGKVTMLAGDPGLGKSFLTLDMAARVSTGMPWPDCPDVANPAGGVVLLNCEDDLADTIRPRLDRAGADCGRINALAGVRVVSGETGEATDRAFSLEWDLHRLETAITATPGCRLVIVDPITAYLGKTDSHKNAEIRALLAPLGEIASRLGVAVVCVSHLNKGSGPAMYRTMGSLAFVAAARAAWAVTKDKNDFTGTRRLVLPVKNNLGPDNSGLAYALVEGSVRWEPDPVTVTADEALAPVEGNSAPGPEPEALEDAAKWLRELLNPSPMLATEVIKQAGHCGISKRTLDRAKRETKVEAYRPLNPGPWYWRLPGTTLPTSPATATHSELGDLGNVAGNTVFDEGVGGADCQVNLSGNLVADGVAAEGALDPLLKPQRKRRKAVADAGMRTPNNGQHWEEA